MINRIIFSAGIGSKFPETMRDDKRENVRERNEDKMRINQSSMLTLTPRALI